MLTIIVSVGAAIAVGLGMMAVIPASSPDSQWIGVAAIATGLAVAFVVHGADKG